jgi:hypothetical protein
LVFEFQIAIQLYFANFRQNNFTIDFVVELEKNFDFEAKFQEMTLTFKNQRPAEISKKPSPL